MMLCGLLTLAAACGNSSGNTDPREQLKVAFVESLYKAINYDSSKVRYRVDEVIYYEDTKYYDCQFKLTMFRKVLPTRLAACGLTFPKTLKK